MLSQFTALELSLDSDVKAHPDFGNIKIWKKCIFGHCKMNQVPSLPKSKALPGLTIMMSEHLKTGPPFRHLLQKPKAWKEKINSSLSLGAQSQSISKSCQSGAWPRSSFRFSVPSYGKTWMNFQANPIPYLKNCLKVSTDEEMLDCAARCTDFFFKEIRNVYIYMKFPNWSMLATKSHQKYPCWLIKTFVGEIWAITCTY